MLVAGRGSPNEGHQACCRQCNLDLTCSANNDIQLSPQHQRCSCARLVQTVHSLQQALNAKHLCREAFAAWLPVGGVPLSYAVAIAYVLVDTYDKGHAAYLQAGIELDEEGKAHPDLNLPR